MATWRLLNLPDYEYGVNIALQANIYRGIPPTLAQLEVAAENFFDDMNSHHGETIKRAVLNMKKRARACLQNLGGTFEGKKSRQ